ncbi:MAG: hypothetical protein PVF49_11725 [Anaerolineales bacterium]|jgi:hypothetical protein
MENQDWKALRRLKTFLWIYLLFAAIGLLSVFATLIHVSLLESARWIIVIWLLGGIGAVFSLIKIRAMTGVSDIRPFTSGDLAYAILAGPLAWGSFVMTEMQICPQCGRMLYPEHNQCIHCTAENPDPTTNDPTEQISAEQTSS